MRLPSTCTTAFSGSIRVPISRTTMPSTFTRPARISSSALRRDATPADASTFCSRTPSSSAGAPDPPGSTRSDIVKVPDVGQQGTQGRQLGQVAQAQPLQEHVGGAVERAAGVRIDAAVLYQPPRHQGADDAVDVDAAHRGDPGAGDRLPV